jgi:Ca2+-binding RTX toxin-like protein
MAIVNAGPVAPLDMTNVQLLTLQNAATPIYDVNQVRLDGGLGRYDDVRGSGFTYDGGGYDYYGGGSASYDPTSGVVGNLTEVANGATIMDVSGMSVSAPALFAALRMGDGPTMMNLLFGGDDIITGAGGADSLDGLGGNDTIAGAAGADSVRGFEGNDQVDGGAGDDNLNGNLGDDVVRGGDGADFVRGGQGTDIVFGDAADDPHVNGNIGNDEVHGGAGADTVFGGQGNDLVMGEDGDDQLSGDLGNDTLLGGLGADRFQFRVGSGRDVATDFNAAEGDRILLPTGTAYTLANVNGEAAIDLGGGEQLTLTGVSAASFNAAWVVFG